MARLLGVARELRSGQSMEWHTQENWTLQSTGQSRENWPDRRYGAEFAFNHNTGSMSTRLCKGLLRWHSEENQTKMRHVDSTAFCHLANVNFGSGLRE